MTSGWIGCDLDGTLAVYNGWNGGEIGPPVPAMLERVRTWLRSGIEVRIVTARVAICDAYSSESQRSASAEFAAEQRALIEAWCVQHLGLKLAVTAQKDFAMVELWDDRCRQVEINTGRVLEWPAYTVSDRRIAVR